MSRADELIKNDRIVFSPKLGTFTTKGTDNQPRVVTLFPEKCSCSIKSCYHILAVKKSLGMEVFFFDRTVVAASDFNKCTMINCDLVNKFGLSHLCQLLLHFLKKKNVIL